MTASVWCFKCQEWIPVKDVEIDDVWEGFMGEDTAQFTCLRCGREGVSKVVGDVTTE